MLICCLNKKIRDGGATAGAYQKSSEAGGNINLGPKDNS